MSIWIRRAYERPTRNDGQRVLVDGVWPRGVSKEDLEIDVWLRDLAPSTGLRKWFGHDPDRWDEFRRRYFRELAGLEGEPSMRELRDRLAAGRVTLVYGAREERYNNAVALREYLERGGEEGSS